MVLFFFISFVVNTSLWCVIDIVSYPLSLPSCFLLFHKRRAENRITIGCGWLNSTLSMKCILSQDGSGHWIPSLVCVLFFSSNLCFRVSSRLFQSLSVFAWGAIIWCRPFSSLRWEICASLVSLSRTGNRVESRCIPNQHPLTSFHAIYYLSVGF